MTAYICVTYAQEDRDVNDGFCRALSRYGFRYQCIHEHSDPVKRGGVLTEASLVIALTSAAADRAETVGGDIRRALERGMTVLCVSLEENPLDHRFCVGSVGGAIRIPYPMGKTPDRHSVALFVHRLFVRHLTRFGSCFVESRCTEDVYGTIVSLAHAAHGGDGEACYALGRAYETGEGLPDLENEAALWMDRAAEQGVPDALIRMGMLRLLGKGTERSPETAFSLFSRAAEQGDRRGAYRCGLCYLDGLGVVKDPEQGILYLRSAADAGYGPALYRLGCLCRNGEGMPQDGNRARDLLYAAVRALAADERETCIPVYGRPLRRYTCVTLRHLRRHSLRRLLQDAALAYREEAGTLLLSDARCMGRNTYRVVSLPEDASEGGLFRRAEGDSHSGKGGRRRGVSPVREWDEPSPEEVALALGQLLAEGDSSGGLRAAPYAALRWYRYAMRLGSVEAACVLADAYRRGQGLPALPARAVELYRAAADRGSLRGQYAYAVCCEQGIVVTEDPYTAVAYYMRAAEAGYAPAQNNLGGCYEMGRGVVKNPLLAVEWYARAADAGLSDAQCRLGICYETGLGVSQDRDRAFRLYEAAAAKEHPYALYRLGLFYHRRAHEHDGSKSGTPMVTELLSRIVPKGSYEEGVLPLSDAEVLEGVHAEENGALPNEPTMEEEALFGVSDRLQALSFYRRSARAGSPDGAYGLFICYRQGVGVAHDPDREIECLRLAAAGGHLQAEYELGLCHLEGRGMTRDLKAAVACFQRVKELWQIRTANTLWGGDLAETNALPPDGMPARRAAGGALYLLGYCALYGLGEEGTPARLDAPPSPQRVETAVPFLREAARIYHAGACTLLGDLCAYGLLPTPLSSPEDESLRHYLDAGRVGSERADRHVATGDNTDSTVDALLSLAKRSLQVASRAEDEGDAALARVNAWHSFSDSAELGSADALVGMAECLYRGWGESRNLTYARQMLFRAVELDGGRVEAALWLGDMLRSFHDGDSDLAGADAVYLRGLECPCVESECGPYTLGLRRADRRRADQAARTEVRYRLATLRAVSFADEPDRRESFPYLAEAILQGQTAALDDFARMYAYETTDPRAVRVEEETKKPFTLAVLLGLEGKRAHRPPQTDESESARSQRAALMHHTWLSDYYTALCPEPRPFSMEMDFRAVSGDIPDYVRVPVTPLMRINALCYLGECYFEGRGLTKDPVAAVTCFEAAVRTPMKLERNQAMPVALVNAIYSLGWCRLYGVGTEVNAVEAVKLLNRVAKLHSGAAYTLGICHEEGRGVVIPDTREAVKHYRKAESMGHPKAAERALYLEKLLNNPQDA